MRTNKRFAGIAAVLAAAIGVAGAANASAADNTRHLGTLTVNKTEDAGWGGDEPYITVIGGEFSHVAGQPRAGLAHVGAGGELDPTWAPVVDAPHDGLDATVAVKTLGLVGDTVYVGGSFTAIDGHSRAGLAAVDAVGGRLRPWNPWPNGDVHALVAASGAIFVGGAFTRIGSAVRRRLAAFDAATGTLTAWSPGVTPVTTVGVNALVADRGRCMPAASSTRSPARSDRTSPRSMSRPER